MNTRSSEKPVFSIVIPHYNSSGLLKRLVDSITAEKDFSKDLYELIIVDDNSSQDEYNALCEIAGTYNHIILLKNSNAKKGAGAARNTALPHIRGDWVLFADSDDYFTKEFYKNIKSYIHSPFDLVIFQPASADGETLQTGRRHIRIKKLIDRYLENKSNKNKLRLIYGFTEPWSKLYRASFLKENDIKFDEVIAANDVFFSALAAFHAKKIRVDTNTIYCWTFSPNSITTGVSKEKFESVVGAAIKKDDFLKNNLTKGEYKSVCNTSSKLLATSLLRNKFGVRYTLNLFVRLQKSGMRFFKLSDISLGKISNFLFQNKYYR